MAGVKQGDLLKVGGLSYPVMVVSNGFFNGSGKAIVCPVVKDAVPGPLHIELKDSAAEGFVLCEQLRYVDLGARRFSKLSEAPYYDTVNISDAIMGIFDYQVL